MAPKSAPDLAGLDDLGKLIRKARRDRGFTQDTFAVKLGIAQSEVSSLERGTRPDVTVGLLARVARVAGIDFALLAKAAEKRARGHRVKPASESQSVEPPDDSEQADPPGLSSLENDPTEHLPGGSRRPLTAA